ncbi:hypothetical protein Moror_6855 [Moniliophthora roreri MCA 2997]|uniref:Uncharacterized protein n=1 Tax=Moniliophthora roreri (strain MCA 2997) TaxID=1381753 RepID=V2XVT6_MONRO|nr:hypothetical protein Moror_6855 [Moniliophthora roreri MCA 2997]
MAEVEASLILFLTTSAVTILSWFLFFPKTPFVNQTHSTPPVLRKGISALLLVHTLFILYSIIILPPPNIFTRLHLSLGTPTDAIRSLLLRVSDDTELPRPIENVLQRFGSFEMRTLYVRFGHNALATCEYCSSYTDFALYALPGPLLAYLREATLIGLITIKGTRLERYRTYGIGPLVAVAATECYWISSVAITIPKDTRAPNGIMWHDTLTLLRQVLFLLLPLILHFFLRPSPPPLTQEVLLAPPGTIPSEQIPEIPGAVRTLQSLITKLQLLRLSRGAVQRHPDLRRAAGEYWAAEREEGEWVRTDEDVQKIAKDMKLGYDKADGEVGPLRENVRMAVENLFRGFVPSSWGPPPIPQR